MTFKIRNNRASAVAVAAVFVIAPLAAQTTPELREVLTRLDRLEQENRDLMQQILELRKQVAAANPPTTENPTAEKLEERASVHETRIDDLAQTRVEASQKLPLRITGMALFNAYVNGHANGNAANPTVASATPGQETGGATLRQTTIGLEYRGAQTLFGATASGSLSMDFFGGSTASLNHLVRLRTAEIDLDWSNRGIMVGQEKPTPSERQGIADGVDFVMGNIPPELRTFGTIRRFMGFEEGGAGDRIEPWCRGGEYGWAFDGRSHILDFNRGLCGVDLTDVMNDKSVMPPMATLLLWMASERMNGDRCVVWLEEAPAYLPTPQFAPIFKGIALRARKRNAALIAIAQMPEHLLENEAGLALIKQARQVIAFGNPAAEREAYCTGLGFSSAEFEMVRDKMPGMDCHPVLIRRQDGQSAVCRFDLGGMPEHLAVLSSTPKSAAMFRSVIAANPGRPMADNIQEFWRRLPEVAA